MDNRPIRARARANLSGNWRISIGIAVVASLRGGLTLNLGNIALNPYKNAAYAAFYRQLQAEKRYTFYK